MSKSHRLAWAAGFIDGEGYITISRRKQAYKDSVYRGHYLRVGVNHVRKDPLIEMQAIFGGTLRLDKTPKGNRKPRYTWVTNCAAASMCLEQIRPYLKNKGEEAQLGIEFQKRMNDVKYKISDEEYGVRDSFKERLMKLNSRG